MVERDFDTELTSLLKAAADPTRRAILTLLAQHGPTRVTDLARRFEDAGIAAIIYTDINRDGAMQGPNVAATAALARAVSIPVIASGGVSSLQDIIALRDCGADLNGEISGRALYDGALDLKEALAALA